MTDKGGNVDRIYVAAPAEKQKFQVSYLQYYFFANNGLPEQRKTVLNKEELLTVLQDASKEIVEVANLAYVEESEMVDVITFAEE